MSRLEAKVERLTDQLGSKERELQALTSKAAAAHKAQLERLQHEKDEFQRMVISTQVLHID
jgi:X breakpoint 2-interacting protein